MADITRALGSRNFSSFEEVNAFLAGATQAEVVAPEPATPLERAQSLVYDAWDAVGPRRIELAREALAISEDCADAWIVLATDDATTIDDARVLIERAVAAGERALGVAFFEENVGHFWGILETRPYMRARRELANLYLASGEHEIASVLLEDLLRLNPGDNQGNRYELLECFQLMGDDVRVGRLLDRYDDDSAAEWVYGRALWAYRVYGDGPFAIAALEEAFAANPYIAPYMFGLWRVPAEPPDSYTPGSVDEAALYVGYFGQLWSDTPGASEWHYEFVNKKIERSGAGNRRKSKKPRLKSVPTKKGTGR